MEPSLDRTSALLIALVPGALTWWTGRRLARRLDDPLLPERLLASRRRAMFVLTACVVALGWLCARDAWWALPLLIIGRMAAAYPLRRALFGETWSVARYLSFFVRLIIGAYGFWIAVLATPWLIARSGAWLHATAAVLLLVLVVWQRRTGDVLRALLCSRPLDHPAVVARLEQIVSTTSLPMPRFEQVDLHGGVVANAVALPSLRRSTVLFSETLVDRLDADELVAIGGHELAHFEFYTRRRLKWMSAISLILVVLAVGVPVALNDFDVHVSSYWFSLGALPTLLLLASIGRHRQRHETESDQRAVALTGDPDALVRALTKLHVIARYPRRWDPKLELQATHPSLARRIQAIRALQSTTAQAPDFEPAVFVAPGGAPSVTLESREMVWRETPASAHTFGYGDLEQLRIVTARSTPPRLLAVDRQGRRWTMPLAPEDVGRAQAVLDRVDVQLAAPAMSVRTSKAVVRVVAALACAAAILGGQIGVLLIALLTFVRPDRVTLAASSAAVLAGAAWLARESATVVPWNGLAAVLLMILGVFLLLLTLQARSEPSARGSDRLVDALSVVSLVAVGLLFTAGFSPSAIFQSARFWPAAVTLPLASASAHLMRAKRDTRWMSAAATLVALVPAAAGTTTFLRIAGRDAFLADAPTVALRPVAASSDSPVAVPFATVALRVSPGGRAVLAVSEDDDDRRTVHVGFVGGTLADFDAEDGLFEDDHRALIVASDDGFTTLREIDLRDGGRVTWTHRLDHFVLTDLALDASGDRWQTLGQGPGGALTRIDGRIGSDTDDRRTWKMAASADRWHWLLAARDDDAFAFETQRRSRLFDQLGPRLAALLQPLPAVTRNIVRVNASGATSLATTPLPLQCELSPVIDEAPICAAFDDDVTRLFVFDPAAGALQVRSQIRGHFWLNRHDAGWAVGYWNGEQVAVDLAPGAHRGLRLGDAVEQLTIAGQTIVASAPTRSGSRVLVFALH